MNKIFHMQVQQRILWFLAALSLFFLEPSPTKAQEPPPRPISVYAVPGQGLNFGAFYQGSSGGTVVVYPDGSRTATGDVVLIGMGYVFAPAFFEIDANPGTLISILTEPVILNGSKGGSMLLNVEGSIPANPFVVTTDHTVFTIGGNLVVGSPLSSPPDTYSGTFQVTFIQE